jgi:hypothetical protein
MASTVFERTNHAWLSPSGRANAKAAVSEYEFKSEQEEFAPRPQFRIGQTERGG